MIVQSTCRVSYISCKLAIKRLNKGTVCRDPRPIQQRGLFEAPCLCKNVAAEIKFHVSLACHVQSGPGHPLTKAGVECMSYITKNPSTCAASQIRRLSTAIRVCKAMSQILAFGSSTYSCKQAVSRKPKKENSKCSAHSPVTSVLPSVVLQRTDLSSMPLPPWSYVYSSSERSFLLEEASSRSGFL